MLNKLYHKGAEIKSAFLNGVNVFGSSEVPVEPSGDMGLAKDYSGSGWYKATDTGTVFNKGVPKGETHVFSDSPKEYVSVYTKEDAKLYGERAATSNVTNMSSTFSYDTEFNSDISSWDVSSVTTMNSMFYNASAFNQDISMWDTSKVINMGAMFMYAYAFNRDLSSWNVSSVTNMSNTFGYATAFNQDISSWNVSSVTDMGYMFSYATTFNQDISSWDVSSATSMNRMFKQATEFTQDLSQWCVSNISSKPAEFETGSALTTEQLPVWGTCPRGEDGSTPVEPETPSGDMGLREDYSGTGWYKATDTGTVFSKDVPEGETHVFSDSPIEYVSVYTKEDVKLYGGRAATSNITDLSMTFSYANTFNQDISSWDVSNVTTMYSMFEGAATFNQDISSWDVSNVTNMWFMFNGALEFNQDISSWDVSSVNDMDYMFSDATSFNQDLSGWCVTKIKTAPNYFDNDAQKWSLPRPVWGTCPRGENLLS